MLAFFRIPFILGLKKIQLMCLLIIMLLSAAATAGPEITAALEARIDAAMADNSSIKGLLMLEDQVDIIGLDQHLYSIQATQKERSIQVISALKQKQRQTQGDLLKRLQEDFGEDVQEIQPLWIINAVLITAKPVVYMALSERNDLALMDIQHEDAPDAVYDEREASSVPNGKEPGLSVINAHKMWEFGFTGAGQIVMNRDTGVEGTHPALASRWLGNRVPASQAWRGGGSFPNDGNSHGTHVMGTITGLDPATNDTIGVAFNAEWMAADFSVNALVAFQWAMDPDGDSTTTDDMPAVIANSWGVVNSTGVCLASTYAPTFNAVEAVGIAIVFSSGNDGPGAMTITAPKNTNTNLVNSWATANLNGHSPSRPIASSSSRGPSACGGSGSIWFKPEAAAPGTAVRSAVLGGQYGLKSGTSMACPHVAGAVALLKEAFPNKTGHEIKLALYHTARETPADSATFDPGEAIGQTTGEDNSYGRGLIDVFQAFIFLSGGGIPAAPEQLNAYSDYQTPDQMRLTWIDPVFSISGDSLQIPIRIVIRRDGVAIDTVDVGNQQYLDSGLIDGQSYQYTVLGFMDSLNIAGDVADVSWIAGGAAQPQAPQNFTITAGDSVEVSFSWQNPADNIDGTPIDDFAGVRLYRDGAEVAVFTRSSADSGSADSLVYNPAVPGFYAWQISVIDNENPLNESELTDIQLTPLSLPVEDDFSDGVISLARWFPIGADINDRAVSPPSGPLALNLNGKPLGGDTLDLRPLDISGFAGQGMLLNFYWQPQGSGNAPEPSDSLLVYLKNDLNEWIEVAGYEGRGLQDFQQTVVLLDSVDAGNGSVFHGQFQLRFRSIGGRSQVVPNDDWFVDDVYLGLPLVAIDQDGDFAPGQFWLGSNYPNPFNPSTKIKYGIADAGFVTLAIYDVLGRRVRLLVSEKQLTGAHEVEWDGRNDAGLAVPSGIYFYRLGNAGQQLTRRMLFLK